MLSVQTQTHHQLACRPTTHSSEGMPMRLTGRKSQFNLVHLEHFEHVPGDSDTGGVTHACVIYIKALKNQ